MTHFQDFYKKKQLRYSFEIFPPKDPQGIEPLFQALRELSVFDPAFVSVTYGAGGSTRQWTRDLALRIHQELKQTTAFHFTCVGSSKKQILDYVTRLKEEGLNLVVALRGDPPQGIEKFVPSPDGFQYASQLVAYLKEINGFSMAVAGYPEGHIEAKSKEEDLIHLKEKVDSGADIVITQLFFDNSDFFDFVDQTRRIGITVPIIPGIMPILSLKQVEKITSMCGAKIPSDLHQELQENQENPEAMKQIGITHALHQCRELVKKKVPGIHFYTLNRSASTLAILQELHR